MSTIEWTDETWNPTVGCSKVSPGCDNCYAIGVAHRAMQPAHEGLTIRRPGEATDWTGEVRQLPDRLDTPLRWRKPRRVFVDSMSDLFHPDVPYRFIRDVFNVMRVCNGVRPAGGGRAHPAHTFQVLTKSPQRMAELATTRALGYEPSSPPPNVWLGTSIESDRYTFRADHLRATPAAVRFLSLEPLLGPLPSLNLAGIDWVIVGGESGHDARPMHSEWVRDIRDRCRAEGVAFFFKQWGNWAPADSDRATHLLAQHGLPKAGGGIADPSLITIESGTMRDPYGPGSGVQDLVDRGHPGWVRVRNVGKKAAGRQLDGRTWDEMPTTAGATA